MKHVTLCDSFFFIVTTFTCITVPINTWYLYKLLHVPIHDTFFFFEKGQYIIRISMQVHYPELTYGRLNSRQVNILFRLNPCMSITFWITQTTPFLLCHGIRDTMVYNTTIPTASKYLKVYITIFFFEKPLYYLKTSKKNIFLLNRDQDYYIVPAL